VPGYFGVYPAIVTNIVDPDRLGRIEVRFPWLGRDGDRDVRTWATLCSPYADDKQGLQILPAVDTEVVVAFEAGNTFRPYILGAAWNGKETLPQTPDAANDIRLLRTRADSRLTFDDGTPPKVSITMASGHKVILDDAAQEITIEHALGCTIRLTATSIDIDANLEVNVTAPMVNVDAAMSTFNGDIQCRNLMAEAFVLSPGYSPGVGNLL
jgi:uncharacterized protein involved in type VI secretion and phage assembly